MPPQQSVVAPNRSFEVISVWALLASFIVSIFVLIPFTAVPLATTKTFLLAAGAIVTLALYIFARLSRGNVILPPLTLVGALWLPVIAYALSAAFSGASFSDAFWGTALEPDTLGFMLVAAVFGTLAALVVRRPEHYRSFFRSGAYVFGIVAVLEVLIVIVGQYAPQAISPTFSILGSFNDLASFLGFGIISVLISFRFIDLSQTERRALIGTSVLTLTLLAIANSLLVWILVALVSLGLFVEAVMKRSSKSTDADLDDASIVQEAPLETGESNHSLVFPLCVLAVSLFFLIDGTRSNVPVNAPNVSSTVNSRGETFGNALANKLNVSVVNVRPSWQATFSVGQKIYADSPFFGSGPGSFGVEWLKHRDASLNSTIFWNVDFSSGIGFIPTSFASTGIVGIIAWVAFLALFVVFGIRTLIMRAPQDSFVRFVAILSFIASLYFFTIAIFDLPNAIILAMVFVFFGIFASTMRFATDGKQWGIIFSRSPRIGFVIVFSLTIVLLVSVVAAYSLVGRSIAAIQLAAAETSFVSGDLDGAQGAAQKSISFAPSSAAYQIQASVARVRLDQIVASSTMPATTAQKEFQDALSSGINAALTATQVAPSNYQNWIVLGNLYAQAIPLGITGAYESAKTAYEKAKELNPTNAQIPYTLAQLDIANKNIKAAKENLKNAIALKQDYTTAIFLLSQLEVQDGNVKEALAAARAAAYFTPNNPNILFQVGILSAAESDFAGAVYALSAAITANPGFANARYFLAAIYAKQGNFKEALDHMQALAALSPENAEAVVSQLAALEEETDPFPANLLTIPSDPVK